MPDRGRRSPRAWLWLCSLLLLWIQFGSDLDAGERPNILLAISDDQSFPYASAYGCSGVETPAFDRIARQGVLFTSAMVSSPGCSPSRASLLTGRHCWQLENAGTHESTFPARFRTFPHLLAETGYFTGYTGKGWGRGNLAGQRFMDHVLKPPLDGIKRVDYTANFAAFLEQRPPDSPFCFWYGGHEPHRRFEAGSGLRAGKKLEDAFVPPFLPDTPEVRSDILDYCLEIEWFDAQLQQMLRMIEDAGELENTLVIVTSDNGMAFPRGKATCYEYGIHVPLAIRWGAEIPPGCVIDDLVSFTDLTATMLEVAGIDLAGGQFQHPDRKLAGRSLSALLRQTNSGTLDPSRTEVFASRERHASARYWNLAYPIRAMRTHQYLYVRNFRPERWPAGAPRKYESPEAAAALGPMHGAYHDIDVSPTMSLLIRDRNDAQVRPFFEATTARRPAVELFDIRMDPGCLNNLAGRPEMAAVEEDLRVRFERVLRETKDPRIVNRDGGEVFETYERTGNVRRFPEPEWAMHRRQEMEAAGWTRLFDGEFLSDWKLAGAEGSFEVVDGMIKAHAQNGEAHLYYVGPQGNADFKNFEMQIECLARPGSNGGIYFHSSYQKKGFPRDGHEVQVNNSHQNGVRTGSLFSLVNREHSPVPDNVFFTVWIRVTGNRVTVKVDDVQTVDYTEPADYRHPRYTERNIDHGTFALQAHDPDSVVYYREIWVRELD